MPLSSIFLLVSSMDSGGAERVAASLANAWSERGESITLVVTFSGRGQCFYPLAEPVKLLYLADYAGQLGRRPRAYWARFWALRQLISGARPDAVVSFLTNVNVAALLATAGLPCHVFVSERTFPPARRMSWLLRALRRMTYPWASGVVMLTAEGLRWLERRIPGAKGVVIPNPVRVPLPRGAPMRLPADVIAPERKLLLAVGRLDEGKQFDRLLQSFSTLAPRHPAWDLAIVGEGPEGPALQRQASALGLDARVRFPGLVGNVGDWYARADLYVMTSRYEGFPNTLAEAMAHGRAAVSYDCDTGPRDIIRHERDGLLVSPVGDVAALTRSLDRLLADDAERERMAAHAAEVRERYSVDKILARWDELMQSGR